MGKWQTRRLGDVADTQLGKMLNKAKQKGDATIPYLRNVNVQWGEIKLDDLNEMDIYAEERDKFTALPGDLLVCEGGEVGRCAIWEGTEPIGIQNAIHRIRTSSELSVYYLRHYLEFMASNGTLEEIASGVTIKHLTQEKLRNLEIAIPPLDQQHEIVERIESALAKIEGTREWLARVLRGLQWLSESASSDEFARFDLEQKISLGDIAEIVSGATPKTADPTLWDGEIPWLTPADLSGYREKYIAQGKRSITRKGFDSCSTRMIPSGSVLFSSRAPIGYAAINSQPVCTNQGFKSLIPGEGVDSSWLYHFVKYSTNEIRSMASGTTFLEISAKKLSSLPVFLPSLDEQIASAGRIESILASTEEIRTRVFESLRLLETLKRSVLHTVFSSREEVLP
jgi:type I restriction enzyme S subunit